MDVITIAAKPRELGKKASRITRNEGRVPCVLYGRSIDSVHFSMDGLELHKLVFTDELHRLQVDLEGESYDCILKSVDLDPVRNEPVHADFQALVAGEAIELNVPISYVGEPIGHKNGGDVQYIIHELTVSCLPVNIPDSLEVNIEALDIGDSLHVSDLSFDNVEIMTPERQTVVSVTAKRVEEEPEEEDLLGEGIEGEAEEGAEGEGAEESDGSDED